MNVVGGEVIGLARGAESTLVHVEDRKSNKSSGDRCSVRVVERRIRDDIPIAIEIGDAIWWQAGKALWTPKANRKPAGSGQRCGIDYDIHIPKVGYSH